MLLTGGFGAGLTIWDLAIGFPVTLVHLGVAFAVLVWLLRGHWPRTRQRLHSVAACWLARGLLGANVFGLELVAARLVSLLALPFDEWLVGRSHST